MRKILYILYLVTILGVSNLFAQQSTPTAKDTTTVRFIVKINVTSANYLTASGRYRIISTTGVEDPVVRDIPYDNSNIQPNMFFVDVSGNIYKIETVTSRSPITFEVSSLTGGNLATKTVDTGIGVIYTPTPNLLLPQWVTTMSATVQNVLLSHMANMIDLKLGGIPSPSLQVLTANYTMKTNDDTVLFNATTGNLQVTLPTPAAQNNGKTYKIGKVDQTGNTLTFAPSLRIDPSTQVSTLNYPRTFIVQSNGSEWWIVNQN